MPYPRPILKRFGASSDDSDSPNFHDGGISLMGSNTNKVHFPNHPDALTRTHLAHSPDDYDRSPIRIKPNACALPERGCPGRTYSGDAMQQVMDEDVENMRSKPNTIGLRRGDHRHPCAKVVGFLIDGDGSDTSSSPSLVLDISDTSEESDIGCASPFLNDPFASSTVSRNRHYSSGASPSPSPSLSSASARLSPKADPAQLAFLPYPRSPPTSPGGPVPHSFYSSAPPTRDSRPVRRSPSSSTHQRHRSRSRVRGSPIRDRHGLGSKQGTHGGQEDEGCLGGF